MRTTICCLLLVCAGASAWAQYSYPLNVLPAEHKQTVDPETGASLTFLTTNSAHDQNLYYEQRSWLADSSLVLFNSSRENGGLMGYLTRTGELVPLTGPKGGLSCATAAGKGNRVFAMRGADVIELSLVIDTSATPAKVTATERVICTLAEENMPPNTSLSENADGTKLALGVGGRSISSVKGDGKVIVIDVVAGQLDEVYRVPGDQFNGHVVFSRHNPYLVSFGETQSWLTAVDIRDKHVVFRHKKVPGEFATHHCWWVGDTITFCGGFHPQPTEDADVKVIDIHTGEVRIVGKGAWWPGATSAELARLNWWHSCGHEDGRWVAADNWYGDIGIFHAGTTRTYILTKGHRTYGKGAHPEVGWDRRGEQVVFGSYKLGDDMNVCVATIPKAWQDEWNAQMSTNPAK